MTEFETKLLKTLEETNSHICNVHTQLYEIDRSLGNVVEAIREVDRSIIQVEPHNYQYDIESIAKNLDEISLDISKIANIKEQNNEKL